MGAKKMGRPKIDNPRSTSIGIRMTPDEKSRLDYVCEHKGVSQREFLIMCVNEVYHKIKKEK